MRKIDVRLWIIGLLLLAMCPNEATAQYKEATVGGLNYWYYDRIAWVVENSREGFVVYPYENSEYTIPETVNIDGKDCKVIGVFASTFAGCPTRHIVLPNTLETIESSAFMDSWLSEISIPSNVTTIRSFAFANTELTKLEIPANVTLIGNYITKGSNLHNIFVDKENKDYKDIDGLLCTADGALIQFPGGRVGTYVIPSSVQRIDNGGLFDIQHLDTLVLSDGIKSISTNACSNTSTLSMLVIGSTMNYIESLPTFKTSGEAALYCFAVTPPSGSFGNETLENVTLYVPYGCKKSYESWHCWHYFKEIKEMAEGTTIEKLGIKYNGPTYGEFPVEHNPRLPVVLKDWVYYILDASTGEAKVDKSGKYASDYDSWNVIYRQEEYDIPAIVSVDEKDYRVTEIVDQAFLKSNVRHLKLPEGLVRIGNFAFQNCHLETLNLPSTVEEIGSYAFQGNSVIGSVTCHAVVPPTCFDDVFNTATLKVPLYVPEASIDNYRHSPVWSDFTDIRAIGSTGITVIPIDEDCSSDACYDLQGRLLSQPQQSGIYIQNGRKFTICK